MFDLTCVLFQCRRQSCEAPRNCCRRKRKKKFESSNASCISNKRSNDWKSRRGRYERSMAATERFGPHIHARTNTLVPTICIAVLHLKLHARVDALLSRRLFQICRKKMKRKPKNKSCSVSFATNLSNQRNSTKITRTAKSTGITR